MKTTSGVHIQVIADMHLAHSSIDRENLRVREANDAIEDRFPLTLTFF